MGNVVVPSRDKHGKRGWRIVDANGKALADFHGTEIDTLDKAIEESARDWAEKNQYKLVPIPETPAS